MPCYRIQILELEVVSMTSDSLNLEELFRQASACLVLRGVTGMH
jgi:hypothetical protein